MIEDEIELKKLFRELSEVVDSFAGKINHPPTDATYLAEIEKQARQMIPQKRNHPSLAIWCGGNELMDDAWVPLSDEHPALAKLRSITNELDPQRLWLPTSSSGPVEGAAMEHYGTGKMHDVHGPWQYQGPTAQYQFFNNLDALYHSEFGAEGAGNLYTIQRFISSCYQWPPDATNPAWVHHGSWWLHREKLESMTGPIDDLPTFIKASQFMQAEGLRYAIESNRRRKWRCSGTSPWQLNEAFPNTACTNAVDYLGLTKPAYWWIRRAYEEIHISAKYDRIEWKPGEIWSAEIGINNSGYPVPGAIWSARLVALTGELIMSEQGECNLLDDAFTFVAKISAQLPATTSGFVLLLNLTNATGTLVSTNEYLFSTAQPVLVPFLSALSTNLQVTKDEGGLHIMNTGATIALFVQITPDDGQWMTLEDDYYMLEPGRERFISISNQGCCGKGTVTVCGWNTIPTHFTID